MAFNNNNNNNFSSSLLSPRNKYKKESQILNTSNKDTEIRSSSLSPISKTPQSLLLRSRHNYKSYDEINSADFNPNNNNNKFSSSLLSPRNKMQYDGNNKRLIPTITINKGSLKYGKDINNHNMDNQNNNINNNKKK
eukprot:283544_1